MRRVYEVAVFFERHPRGIECLRRPAEVARCKRNFRLRDHTPRARNRLPRTKRTRSSPQKNLCAHEIAELRHRNAAQRERRSVVAQGDALQRAEGIAGGERARRR